MSDGRDRVANLSSRSTESTKLLPSSTRRARHRPIEIVRTGAPRFLQVLGPSRTERPFLKGSGAGPRARNNRFLYSGRCAACSARHRLCVASALFGRKMHPGLAALAEDQASSSAGAMLAKLKSLITNREEIRMAIGKQTILARSFFAPTAFSKPESRDIWLQRVRANFAHYRSIYAILFAAVAVYTVLSSPWLLFGLSVIGGAFAYAFVLNSPETPITIAGFELKRREKMLALAPFSSSSSSSAASVRFAPFYSFVFFAHADTIIYPRVHPQSTRSST